MPKIVVPSELFWTDCPNCGYSLKEISASANCPECGRERNNSELVLYARDLRDTSWIPLLDFQFMSDRMIAYWSAFVLYSVWFKRGAGFLIAFFAAGTALAWVRRLDNRHPGDMQIRINADGVVQFPHAGGATTLRKLTAGFLWVAPTVATLVIFGDWLLRPASVNIWLYAPFSVFMVVLTAVAIRRAHSYHRRSPYLSESAVVDFNLAVVPPSPWNEIREYWITPSKNGSYHLQIDDKSHQPGKFVWASVDLSAGGAEALHNLLKEQILAARHAAENNEPACRKTD